MSSKRSLLFLYSIIAILIIVGAIASNENFNNYLHTHPGTNMIYNAFLIIGPVVTALIFIMGRTGKKFSWKMLLVAIMLSAVFIGFGLLKKLV
jgi:hypothetical protein